MRAVQKSILNHQSFKLTALCLAVAVIVTTVEGYAHGIEPGVADLREIISAATIIHTVPHEPDGISLVIPSANLSLPASSLSDLLAALRNATADSDSRAPLIANATRSPGVDDVSIVATTTKNCRTQTSAPINLSRCF